MDERTPIKWDNKAVIVSIISDKINFKLKLSKRNKKEHFIIPKGTISQENFTILSRDGPQSGVFDLIKSTMIEIKT